MRIDLLMDALPIMGTGYLGIFVVTGVIIGVVSLLTKLARAQISDDDSTEVSKLLKVIGALERTSDHCSNIAISIMDAHAHNMNAHQSLHSLKEGNPAFFEKLDDYSRKYRLTQE